MNLTHLDEKDRPKMVDVSDKNETNGCSRFRKDLYVTRGV